MFKNFDYINTLLNGAMLYLPKWILAIAFVLVARWLIRLLMKVVHRAFAVRLIDPSIQTFLASLIRAALMFMVLISAAAMVGIETTSFVAIIGAAGLAIGLALQTNLANFAGGVLILLFKPFKVGDVINVQAFTGTVTAIQMFNTTLQTVDSKIIIIPNSVLSNGIITNFTITPTKRIDLFFSIANAQDWGKARAAISRAISECPDVLKAPEPAIGIAEVTEALTKIAVKAWANNENSVAAQFEMNEKIKEALLSEGLI